MMKSKKFTSVGELRELIKDLPDDHEILAQVVANDGISWRCNIEFQDNIISPDGKLGIITLSHPQLKTLPTMQEFIKEGN